MIHIHALRPRLRSSALLAGGGDQVKTIDCFALMFSDDVLTSVRALFASRGEAERAMTMTGHEHVEPRKIVIYDSAFEWKPELNMDARRSGLAKLTDDEKAALGIRD